MNCGPRMHSEWWTIKNNKRIMTARNYKQTMARENALWSIEKNRMSSALNPEAAASAWCTTKTATAISVYFTSSFFFFLYLFFFSLIRWDAEWPAPNDNCKNGERVRQLRIQCTRCQNEMRGDSWLLFFNPFDSHRHEARALCSLFLFIFSRIEETRASK